MRRLRQPSNYTFLIGLWIILAIGLLSYFSGLKLSRYNALVTHTTKVLAQARGTLSLMQDIETGMRGFVITGDEELLEPYNKAILNLDQNVQRLQALTQDNSLQQLRVGQLKTLKDVYLETSNSNIELRRSKGLVASARLIAERKSKSIMDEVRAIFREFEADEYRLLDSRVKDAEQYSKVATVVTILGSLMAFALVLLASVIVRRQVRELKYVEKNVQHLNLQLADKLVELETSNRELESFSYSVSHDLRAPLRTMVGFSSIILEDHGETLPNEVKLNLTRVVSATQKMGRLIDGLLDLSRLSRKELVVEPVNLSALVESILNDLEKSEPNRKYEFDVTQNLIINGDPRLLHAALYNLLSNACKFTRSREFTKIEFGVHRRDNLKTYFIKDNGAGFDMAYADKLFGIFQRLHSSVEYEGTGIGLATVQRIVQRHGGKIWVDSIEDKGTTFYFNI